MMKQCRTSKLRPCRARFEKTDLGWEIYPDGLTKLLKRVAGEYTDLPLYVTENGLADADQFDDQLRIKYYDQHF